MQQSDDELLGGHLQILPYEYPELTKMDSLIGVAWGVIDPSTSKKGMVYTLFRHNQGYLAFFEEVRIEGYPPKEYLKDLC